jgi:hypothetical protein
MLNHNYIDTDHILLGLIQGCARLQARSGPAVPEARPPRDTSAIPSLFAM